MLACCLYLLENAYGFMLCMYIYTYYIDWYYSLIQPLLLPSYIYVHVGMPAESITMNDSPEGGNQIAVLDRFLLYQPDCRHSIPYT